MEQPSATFGRENGEYTATGKDWHIFSFNRDLPGERVGNHRRWDALPWRVAVKRVIIDRER